METTINLKDPIGIVIYADLTRAFVCLPTEETWYMPSQYDLLSVISRKNKNQKPIAIIEVENVEFCVQKEMPTKYSIKIDKINGFSNNPDSRFKLIDTFNYKILKCNIIDSNLEEPVNIGDLIHFIFKDQEIQKKPRGFPLGKIKTIEQLKLELLPDFIFEDETIFHSNLLVLGSLGTNKRELITQLVSKLNEKKKYAFVLLDPTGIYSTKLKEMKFEIEEKSIHKIRSEIKQSFGFTYMNEAEILNEMRNSLSGEEFEVLGKCISNLRNSKLLRTQENLEHAIQELLTVQFIDYKDKLNQDQKTPPEINSKKIQEYQEKINLLSSSLTRKLKEKLRIPKIIEKNKITAVNFTLQMDKRKEEDMNTLVVLNEIFSEAIRRNDEVHRLTESEQQEKGYEKLNLILIIDKFENLCSIPNGNPEEPIQKQIRETILNIISRSVDFQCAIIGISSISSLLYRDIFHLCDNIIISPESKYAEMKIFEDLLGINLGFTKRLSENQFIFIGNFTKNHPWIIKL